MRADARLGGEDECALSGTRLSADPLGDISLRRRRSLTLDVDIFEIKLGDEFLMSSLFTASEIALAHLGIAEIGLEELDIVVGGLGLGYTASAVLEHDTVRSLTVIEALDPVIEWHRTGLLPLGPALTSDKRCRVRHGDFFALARSQEGFDEEASSRLFHVVLVDIDHSPERLLNPANQTFYDVDGLRQLASHLHPGGVFGLWSDELPSHAFTQRLGKVFASARAERVTFHNPLQNKDFTQTVYLARKAAVG